MIAIVSTGAGLGLLRVCIYLLERQERREAAKAAETRTILLARSIREKREDITRPMSEEELAKCRRTGEPL